MTKEIRCRDVGVDCDWAVTGETEEEIMKKAAEHAKKAHGMNEIPQELVQRVREAIRTHK
jgi:predicted small metal-binding protein